MKNSSRRSIPNISSISKPTTDKEQPKPVFNPIDEMGNAIAEISAITYGIESIAEFLQLTLDDGDRLLEEYSHLAGDFHRANLYRAISSLAKHSCRFENKIEDYLGALRDERAEVKS